MKYFVAATTFFTLSAASIYAHSQSTSGDIRGIVEDLGGSPIAAAHVTIKNPERGISRPATVNAAGEYHAVLLPPGYYRVYVQAPGFVTKVLERVQVRVGDTVTLRTQLEPGKITTTIAVPTEIPVIDTARTQQATIIDSARLRNLPINRRNYLDFALLAPGVVETNDLVDGADFRDALSRQSGLSFGAGNGRGNAFSIDGAGNDSNSGGVRPGVSQEAVREFQVNQNTFAAEFGGAMGGTVNIVTKSGTNDRHGGAFGLLRHRSLQARNYFDPAKSNYVRGQYGAASAAPLKRDKTFLFASFERLDRRETGFVPAAWDRAAFSRLTVSQQRLADYLDGIVQFRPIAAWMRDALIANKYPDTLKLFNTNTGSFPFTEASNQANFRLDHNFNSRHSSFLRGSLSQSNDRNAQFGALIGFNRGHSNDARDATVVLDHIYIPRPRWVSETRAMFSQYRLKMDPTDPFGPEINIAGFGFFGRDISQPAALRERHYQLQENLSYTTGRHSLKFGVDLHPVRDRVRSESFFGGRFNFGETIPLATVLGIVLHDPNFGASLISTLNNLGQRSYAADLLAPVSSLQAYNLGIPLLYQQGFGDPALTYWSKRYNLYAQDTFKATRNLTLSAGLRYELEINKKPVNTDPNNAAPRVGFAWTPGRDGKTVVRGGYGIYYAPIYWQTAYTASNLNGTKISQVYLNLSGIPIVNPATGRPVNSADVYQALLSQGVIGNRAITRNDLAQFNIQPGPNAWGRIVSGIVPNFVNPYAQQAHFEIERAIGSLAVSAGYSFNRGPHIIRSLDRNLYYAGRAADNQPRFGFYDPSILQNNVLESSANSSYHALTLQLNKRFARHYAFNAHYTFSKAMDDVTDYNSDYEPNDQLNARAEKAHSSFNQKHRVVLNGVFEWRNWMLSPIVIANSGQPFNLLAGVDNLGDNHVTTHRPFNAGRNIGIGPSFATVNLRLARRFLFGADGAKDLEATAEAFNLLNRTNFRNVNNTVGNVRLEDLPRPPVGIRATPTTPLAFTSAFDPRQVQLGLRFGF